MNRLRVDSLLRDALAEDIGGGDVTTAVLGADALRPARGVLVARQGGVLCGLEVAARCFTLLDDNCDPDLRIADGVAVEPGQELGRILGPAGSLLTAERVALNLLQHMSGIATAARRLAERAATAGIRVVETRKTLPGLRALEKYAVRVGGGANHRFDLGSAIMLKDNHFALSRRRPGELIRAARQAAGHTLLVLAEAGAPEMVREIIEAGPDVVVLDNFTPAEVRAAAALIAGRAMVEVSGGIGEHNLDAYLLPGVDVISVGSLTHSVRALDIALEIDPA